MQSLTMTYMPRKFSESEVKDVISDMQMENWITNVVGKSMIKYELGECDFTGRHECSVSIDDLATSLFYHAFKIGKNIQWQEDSVSDFVKRSKKYDRVLLKVEDATNKNGAKKLSSIKKYIREGVESRYKSVLQNSETLGVFVGFPEIEKIFNETDSNVLLTSLHEFGNCKQDDPRYYIHMIYRLYMSMLHKKLADNDMVVRYPSRQQVMDMYINTDSSPCIPMEFRMFIIDSGGMRVPVVSLPVPSKEDIGTVVYKYNFENIPWVPVMRNMIYKKVEGWKSKNSAEFTTFYPDFLIKGNSGNKDIMKIVSRVNRFKEVEEKIEKLGKENCKFIGEIVSKVEGLSEIPDEYNNHHFSTGGEKLRERVSFFWTSSCRTKFKEISKKFPYFCEDVYKKLLMSVETQETFRDYSVSKKNEKEGSLLKYDKVDEELWRLFLLHIEKICSAISVCSNISSLQDIIEEYGTISVYSRDMISKLMFNI